MGVLVLQCLWGFPEERDQGKHCGAEFFWGWRWAGGVLPEAVC